MLSISLQWLTSQPIAVLTAHAFQTAYILLLAKMEAKVDTQCLLVQPKEGQQQFKNKKQELTKN